MNNDEYRESLIAELKEQNRILRRMDKRLADIAKANSSSEDDS